MLSRRIAVPLSFAVMSVEYWLIVKVSTFGPIDSDEPEISNDSTYDEFEDNSARNC